MYHDETHFMLLSSEYTAMQDERRAYRRFSIQCNVRYRIRGRGASEPIGVGRTVDMSRGGLLITTNRVLSPGSRIEIEMDWPVDREGVMQRLIIVGKIARSERRTIPLAGVKMSRHAFRTPGGMSAGDSSFPGM